MMDPEQEEIFKEIILDHHKRPRNAKLPAEATHRAEGRNPETGDRVALAFSLNAGAVSQIGIQAEGSAVLVASCSLLSVFARGKSVAGLLDSIQRFLELLNEPDAPLSEFESFGDIIALSGIRQFPARVKCASLPWRTFQQELQQSAVE